MTAAKKEKFILAAIVAVGMLLRLAFVVMFAHQHRHYDDESAYWDMAGQILHGHGLSLPFSDFEGLIHANAPTAYFGAFAVFIVPLRLIFAGHLVLVRGAVAAISWPALAIAIDIFARPAIPSAWGRAGLVLLLAVFPDLIFLQSLVMSEAMFIPLVIVILLFGRWAKSSDGWSITLGAAYGISLLIRPNLIAFLPIHLVMIFIHLRGPILIRRAFAVLVPLIVVISPWLVRNEIQFHRLMLESKSGFNLVLMNNPGDNAPMWSEDFTHPVLPHVTPGDEGQMDLEYRAIGKRYILERPTRYLSLCVSRFHNSFNLAPTYMKLPGPVMLLLAMFNGCIYLATIVGGFICVRRGLLIDAVVLIVYGVIVQSMTNGSFRHRSYIDPLMCSVAIAGLLSVLIAPHCGQRAGVALKS